MRRLRELQPRSLHRENRKLYFLTDKGTAVDRVQLSTLDPATGKTAFEEEDPLKRVDLEDAMFSDVDGRLLATTYEDDKQRIYSKDKSFEADYNFLKSKLPGREIAFLSHTSNKNVWILMARSDVEPGEVYLFDRASKKLDLQYRMRDDVPREALAEQKVIRYPSPDGLEISAYWAHYTIRQKSYAKVGPSTQQ